MIIHYAQNPLASVVELDDRDVQFLRAKVEIEELEERVYGAWFALKDLNDVAKALKELDVDSLEEEPLKKAIDRKMEWLVASLSDHHAGDCTCIPCSCAKCHAESLLGIDTIKGLGKFTASRVRGAFSKAANVDEAIQSLLAWEPKKGPSWNHVSRADFDKHVPRWRDENKAAIDWLTQYRQHFA